MGVNDKTFPQTNPYTSQITLVAGAEVALNGQGREIGTYLNSALTFVDSGDAKINKGQPCLAGTLPGVALDSAVNTTDYVNVQHNGVFALSVKGEASGGNSAISYLDKLYYDTDGEINVDSTNGTYFGRALAAVGSGSTTVIPVRLG